MKFSCLSLPSPLPISWDSRPGPFVLALFNNLKIKHHSHGLPLEGSRKSMVKVIQAAAPERVCDRRGKWHPVGTCAKQMGSVSLPDLPWCLSSSIPRFHLHSRLMPDKMQGEEAVKNCCRHCLYNAAAQTSRSHWSQSCLHCS